jgi:phage terminase large subunit-like protein
LVKGAVFDPARVDKVIKALRALRHTKGKWAGRPLEPTATQVAFIIAPVFGWVVPDADGDLHRIIRDAYVEMPRKGAKTTLTSALAMIMAFGDGEPGAEVILGAASKDQAGQAYKPLEILARNSALLLKAGVKPTKTQITRASDGSFIKAVSSRGDLAHGANVHGGLIDELHVHKNGDLLEAIESGTGARSQPITWIITTADEGSTTSPYAQRRALIEKLAKRTLKAPAMYGVIFAAPETLPCTKHPPTKKAAKKCDVCNDDGEVPIDPFAEETWAMANPLYPVTPSPEFMRAAADKAKANPTALASFLRLHLGIRSKKAKQYIDITKWDRNGSLVDRSRLKGREAWGGLDLASVSDLTALAWALPDEDAGYDVLWRFWLPEEALPQLDAATAGSASGWVKQGWITLTPGDVTDYDFLKRDLLRDLNHFDVQGIGYDRWNSSQLVIDLEEKEDAPMIKVGQGVASLSAPMKEMDRLIRAGTNKRPLLRHGGNPVARWMADNLVPYTDAAGNVKPDKAKSMEKIDGMSALVTALAVAMTADAPFRSAYEDRGLITV